MAGGIYAKGGVDKDWDWFCEAVCANYKMVYLKVSTVTIKYNRSFIVAIAIISTITSFTTVSNYNNVFAGGPRLDYDMAYEDVSGAPECWVDGYDAGFAQKYDKNRADECADIPGDQYNASWGYGCIDSGLTEDNCNDIKDSPQDIENHETLQEENRRGCYDDGYEDGRNSSSFNKDIDSGCSEYGNPYSDGFRAGCESVEGNTQDSCTLTIEGHEIYCPNNPDDQACTEFLHDVSNKRPPETGPLCGQEPSDPGCFKNQDPEKYCLNHYDPVFCKTVGNICDADGFVKLDDAYCTE
jgi:hypothetical protein